MYIKFNNKEIEIRECVGFFNRFKGLMFLLQPINYCLRFAKCNSIHTYFMFQKIDIIMTDKNNKIIKIYKSLRSEKVIWPKRKVYFTYELPEDFIPDDVKIGDYLIIQEKKETK